MTNSKNVSKLTEHLIKESVYYDPEDGILIWKITYKRAKLGATIGNNVNGYLKFRINNEDMLCHRVAWFLYYEKWPEQEIDHINRIKTDNRIKNLRDVSHSENLYNRKE